MIVKNEAATLEKCLSTARPHVDEIVVVDTGSTDGTQDIARRYADTVAEIEWPDSFAAARNYSFERGTCDYIMYLDGDEYIPEAHHWKRLRRALMQSGVAGIQVPIRNLLGEGQIMAADRVWQDRVFRNHPTIRFNGRVHNQVYEGLTAYMKETGEKTIQVEAEVIHTGYALAPEKMKEKYRPRLHLLQAEYENPRSERYKAYYGYQLGVVYFVLDESEKAAQVFSELNYDLLTRQNAFYTHLLAAQTGLKRQDSQTALAHCEAMLVIDRNEPVAYYTTGLAFLQAERVADGMLMLLEAFNMNDRPGASVRFLLNPKTLLRALALFCNRIGLADHAKAFSALDTERTVSMNAIRAIVSTLQTSIAVSEVESAG